MGQKKNQKIFLIIILLIIILSILIGVTYVYLATDTFKSNKELFLKYIVQIGEEKNGFVDNKLKEYFAKKKDIPNNNEGTLQLNVMSGSEIARQYDTINNFNISFSGQTNHVANSIEQDISLNYSDEASFPIRYQKVGNTIGIKTQYIGSKYIAVETDKLEEQTYVGLEDVSNLLEGMQKLEALKNIPFSKEELQQLKEKYSNIIYVQLQETQFSKLEEEGKKGYKLSLEGDQVKNIVVQLLQTLKNDQATLDKINEYIKEQKNSVKLTANNIDNTIKNIEQNSEINDKEFEITVFQQKGKLERAIINIPELEITLEKKEENSLSYSILLATKEEDKQEISFNANYNGLDTLQNVNETYELEIKPNKSKLSYRYQYSNQINFVEAVTIEDFSNDNAMILNQYEEEQINGFLAQVKERIQMVNSKQMEELGLEENESPFLQMLVPIEQVLQSKQAKSIITNTDIDQIEVNDFNQKFENYQSTNLKGATVKGLLTTIASHNEAQDKEDRKIKEIHFDGEEYEVTDQNIAYLKSSIETESSYRVEFERDESTGMIYRAVINKK